MRSLALILLFASALGCRSESTGPLAQVVALSSPSVAASPAAAAPATFRLTYRANTPIREVAFSPDGRWLATACAAPCGAGALEHSRVLLFALPSLELRGELSLDPDDLGGGRVFAMAFSADSSRLAVSHEGGVSLFRSNDRTLVRDIAHLGLYSGFGFSPDSKYLALSGVFGRVDVIDAVTGSPIVQDQLHGGEASYSASLAWTRDSQTLIVEGNARVATWSPGNTKLADIGDTSCGTGRFELSRDEKWLLLSEEESCDIKVYSMATRALAQRITSALTPGTLAAGTCVAHFSPDGAWVAAIDQDAAVRLAQTGSPRNTFEVVARQRTPQLPTTIAFSPDSARLLYDVGEARGIWDVASQRVAEAKPPTEAMDSAAWVTPDVIAFRDADATVFFDVSRQARVARPREATEGILDPTGKVRAIASGDLHLLRDDGVELWLRVVLEGEKRRLVVVDSRGHVDGHERLIATEVYDERGKAPVPQRQPKLAERFFAGE